jgi:2-hydroxychromene-2-carboxylate isomerase
VARGVGLDLARFETDRGSEAVRQHIRTNVEQGIRLGLDGTPAVFLNGRRVYDLRLRALELLIGHELKLHNHEQQN